MKNRTMTAAAVLFIAGAIGAQAQNPRIPIRKDAPPPRAATTDTMRMRSDTMHMNMNMSPSTMPMDSLPQEWYMATGRTCSSVDVSAARAVQIKTDLYNASTMISPDSAKVIALCAVPGQIGSGEMNVTDGRTEYAVDIIPNGKKTHTKVIVDAATGAVLSSKQFGGLRGLAGWVRESAEHKKNTKP